MNSAYFLLPKNQNFQIFFHRCFLLLKNNHIEVIYVSNDIENDSNSGENLDDDEKNEFDDKSDDSDNTNPQTNNTSNLKVLALHGGGESSSSFQNQQGMQDLRNALPEFEFIFASSCFVIIK